MNLKKGENVMSENGNDRAGVIAPPPLIYLAGIGVGLALEYIWPAPLLPQDVQYGVGAALIAVAFLIAVPAFLQFRIAVPAFLQFRKAKTDVDPYKPVTAIISTGPFRWTRNPLYLAMAVLQLGVAFAVDGIWIALMIVPAVIVIQYGVIVREERYLERKFGDEYLSYKTAVRRWV